MLGTILRIRAWGLPREAAQAAMDAGFAAAAGVHRAMSFHLEDSDVSRLNRGAYYAPVRVERATFAVLSLAQRLSEASNGAFDVTVAPHLVKAGLLPHPAGAPVHAAGGSWRDMELIAPDVVRFHRALWVDLGGIAKGHAVDAAIEALVAVIPAECSDQPRGWRVEAGGDLRVAGQGAERIALHRRSGDDHQIPLIDLEEGSLASSEVDRDASGGHVHGQHRALLRQPCFASVAASSCMIADALTKVVLALGNSAVDLLREYDAIAFVHRPGQGWSSLGSGQ